MKKVVIIAGDKSADIYGGLLCKRLKEQCPSIGLYSFGGKHLALYSNQIINLVSHSIGGIFEVISSLTNIIAIFKTAIQKIHELNPDLIILIDFPDFNLRLAKKLNKKYPLFYYISPQLWAWRQNRLTLIKKYVDKMIVIFRFEQDFYRSHGIEALYFGHPLLEIVPSNTRETKKIISFLPGSRTNEIKYHLPLINKVKTLLTRQLKGYSFQIIRPENIPRGFYNKFISNIEIVDHSYEKIQESAFIVTASGTATVEIALLNVPFLIIYKMNPLTWHILKRIVSTKSIGMVNILASQKIVEEFLQNAATPQAITQTVLYYLNNTIAYQKIKQKLQTIKATLAPYGATEKLANYICEYFQL